MIFTVIHYKKKINSRCICSEFINTENRAVAIWKFHNKYNHQYIITEIIHLTKI